MENHMDLNEFACKVRDAVAKELNTGLCENCKVEIKHIRKNNGVKMQGLLISSEGECVIPTIYLESFYQAYEKGISLREIVDEIICLYREGVPKKSIDMSFYKDYDAVKDRICYRLIRREGNEELLKDIPYIAFLDLAVCFYYAFQDDFLGEGSILIYHTHREIWNITTQQLLDLAIDNTGRLFPEVMCSITDVINDIRNEGETEIFEVGDEIDIQSPMTILTNTKKSHGAACILYPNVLEKFARKRKDSLYIIPSSIHEVILLEKSTVSDPEDVKRMIYEVNRLHLSAEEVLSDNLYFYDFVKKTVSIV